MYRKVIELFTKVLRDIEFSSSNILMSIKIVTYYVCDVTMSVYPHWGSLKNMPGHGGNRTHEAMTCGILAQCSAN